MRTTTDVIHDHLRRRLDGDLDGDIENYGEDVVQLTGSGIYRGRSGIRDCAAELQRLVGSATFTYRQTLVDGPYAFLEWTAESDEITVGDGADGFVVHDGRIVLQTIHYTPRRAESADDPGAG
ncbi:nuclear transport factor 2 family protein [Microbacterium resistens]